MKPERWQQISQIFEAAKSLSDEERTAFVRRQCGDDDSLRQDVENLIKSHRQVQESDFIDGVAMQDAAPLLEDSGEHVESNALRNGEKFGSYLILKKLGAGGMGEVYLAQDARLQRTVALKILPPDVATDKRRMQRFRQEARVASSLNQPNIVTIYEFGEVGPLAFLATELVEGETLRDYLYGKRLKLGELLDIGIQILAALDAAHEAKIVHRDIKPENVMIRRRDHVVKVLDFGLAKLTEKKSTSGSGEKTDTEAATEFKSVPGTILGTINYMSPEQAQAKEVDQRTDIWSAGVILYEIASGEMPFKGPTAAHTIVQIIEKEPQLLTQSNDQVPPELQRIISKALAKKVTERYQSARDMLIDLRNLRKQIDLDAHVQPSLVTDPVVRTDTVPASIAASDRTISPPARRQGWSVRILSFAVVVGLLVLGVGAYLALRHRNNAVETVGRIPPTNVERKLVYSITVQKYRDKKPFEEPFQLAREILFERDYQIRLNVSSPQSGFLYVLNEGPRDEKQAPEYVVMFPSPTSNNGSAFVTESRQFHIPEKSWFHFDSEKGTEKVWLVFAPSAIPELEPIRGFANQKTQGLVTDASVRDTVESFLKSHATPMATATEIRDRKETQLQTSGEVLVYVIKLEHQ